MHHIIARHQNPSATPAPWRTARNGMVEMTSQEEEPLVTATATDASAGFRGCAVASLLPDVTTRQG